jgi:hypothetical protein
MQFYSGFSLQNEAGFFEPFLDKSDFCVCGFSYGAIKATEAVEKALEAGRRVDRLQLFSPAFFQTKEMKFKRLQLMAYRKNEEQYLRQFVNACFLPYERKEIQRSVTVMQELEELLFYEWSSKRLYDIKEQGVVIEVYLGGKDQIIDSAAARDFFKTFATVSFIKNANHFLLCE